MGWSLLVMVGLRLYVFLTAFQTELSLQLSYAKTAFSSLLLAAVQVSPCRPQGGHESVLQAVPSRPPNSLRLSSRAQEIIEEIHKKCDVIGESPGRIGPMRVSLARVAVSFVATRSEGFPAKCRSPSRNLVYGF